MSKRKNRNRANQSTVGCKSETTPAPLPATGAVPTGFSVQDEKPHERDDKLIDNYRASLISHEQDTGKEFDKAILTVAAIAFGFSVSLVKDYIKPQGIDPRATSLLYASWALFGIPIALILINLQLTYSAAVKYRKITDVASSEYGAFKDSAEFWKNLKERIECVRRTEWVEISNWVSLCAVVAGIIAFAMFAVANTKGSYGRKTTEFSETTIGATAEDSNTANPTKTGRTTTRVTHGGATATATTTETATKDGLGHELPVDAPHSDHNQKSAATSEEDVMTKPQTREVKPGGGDSQRTATPSTPRVPLTQPSQKPQSPPSSQPKK